MVICFLDEPNSVWHIDEWTLKALFVTSPLKWLKFKISIRISRTELSVADCFCGRYMPRIHWEDWENTAGLFGKEYCSDTKAKDRCWLVGIHSRGAYVQWLLCVQEIFELPVQKISPGIVYRCYQWDESEEKTTRIPACRERSFSSTTYIQNIR